MTRRSRRSSALRAAAGEQPAPRALRLLLLAVAVACASALAVPAAGVARARGGTLRALAWRGYLQPRWVRPFEHASGCRIRASYASSSEQMAKLVRTGRYDVVSASGDIARQLVEAREVRPLDTSRIPSFAEFAPAFRSPATTTVGGRHYGVALEWGPNALVYDTRHVKPAPASWSALYDSKYQDRIAVPDDPMQIADAALYLMRSRPALRITDPYELDRTQFDAAVALLEQQKPLVETYWGVASDEIEAFESGDAWLGSAWPYQTNTLRAANVPVKEVVPAEGATAWLDSWMVSSRARSLGCAYAWLAWVSRPKVQAEEALAFGGTPVNGQACTWMDRMAKGSCAAYHADATAAYLAKIRFWQTPLPRCGNGRRGCVGWAAWQKAWAQLRFS